MDKDGSRHFITDKKISIDGYGTLEYISKKAFQKKFPKEQGGFKVIGAIGNGTRNEIGETSVCNKSLSYFELKYKKFFYAIDGYVEVEDHQFVAVVKKVLFLNIMKVAVVLSLIIGAVFGGYYYLENRGPDLEPGAEKYVADIKVPDDFEEGRIAIPGYSDFKIYENTDKLYVALWNPDENPCYFRFTIILKETGEELYKSKLITPGLAVTTVPLSRSFSEGIYPVTVRIDSYSLKDHKEKMNGGEIDSRIVAMSSSKVE